MGVDLKISTIREMTETYLVKIDRNAQTNEMFSPRP